MRHAVVLIVLALSLVGCGGSDGDSDSPTTSTTEGSSGATTTSLTTTTTSEASNGGSGIDCLALKSWAEDSVAAINPAFAGGRTSSDGVEFSAEFFQEFADRAPSEIRADMQIFANAYTGFFDAIEDLGFDFSDPTAIANMDQNDMADLDAAIGMMDSPEVTQALDNIEAFFERECP